MPKPKQPAAGPRPVAVYLRVISQDQKQGYGNDSRQNGPFVL